MRTDAGDAYLKVRGNPRGEHVLVAEYVGTRIAALMGLPTLDVAILTLEACDRIDLGSGCHSKPGSAFATRELRGHAWGGDGDELDAVENQEDFALLVVTDTLLLNPDRFGPRTSAPDEVVGRSHPDNVFIAAGGSGRPPRLIAMDFTDCLTSGAEITTRIARIDRIRDEGLYGLFSEFKPRMTKERIDRAVARLGRVTAAAVDRIVGDVPVDWDLPPRVRISLVEMISARATWLADTIGVRLASLCQLQRTLFDEANASPEDAT